jgi:hypothetical protein
VPVNISTEKALVPIKSFIPVPKPAPLDAVFYDLYPRRYRDQIVFTICVPDESDDNYGPDGKKLKNPNYEKFIDIYA